MILSIIKINNYLNYFYQNNFIKIIILRTINNNYESQHTDIFTILIIKNDIIAKTSIVRFSVVCN